MTQKILRIKYYGLIQDGTILMVLNDDVWYLAKMKNADIAYFVINYNDGVVTENWSVPRYSEFYFPSSFDMVLTDHISNVVKQRKEILAKEQRKYELRQRIVSIIFSVTNSIKRLKNYIQHG